MPMFSGSCSSIDQNAFSESTEQNIDKQTVLEWLGTTDGIVATPHSQLQM